MNKEGLYSLDACKKTDNVIVLNINKGFNYENNGRIGQEAN